MYKIDLFNTKNDFGLTYTLIRPTLVREERGQMYNTEIAPMDNMEHILIFISYCTTCKSRKHLPLMEMHQFTHMA